MGKSIKKHLKLTLVKSVNGHSKRIRLCVKALGLKRINHSVVRVDTPAIRGLVKKITFLLRVEESML